MRTARADDELRPVSVTRSYTEMTPGSVLFEMGRTRVLCTAGIEVEVPRWMRDRGEGWVTAEYAMLPGSSTERIRRSDHTGGRAKEIQRLIGRALRAVVDMGAMGEMTVRVDCDVIQADGGTRTASITGAWIALHDAFSWAVAEGVIAASPLKDHCAAVSVGVIDSRVVLDLPYEEDVAADVDFNVVMTGAGRLIEVQGTAEREPYTREQLDEMLDVAARGIERLVRIQAESVAG